MNKGIYIALSGAVLKQKHMEVHAQNIANANTAGFKKERMSFKDYIIPVDNRNAATVDGRSMAQLSNVVVDYSSGSVMRTDNPLDVVINGEGFFVIEGNKYTRNGNFTISDEGNLITQTGENVLGEGGPIAVQGGQIDIGPSGEIFIDNVSIGKLQIVNFPDKGVLKGIGGEMFSTSATGEEINAEVSQGFLEASNVNAIQEMIQMIKSQREFESYQKIIHAFDEASSRTINEMGR
jgi:flagellar basal-body rod protein FlgG